MVDECDGKEMTFELLSESLESGARGNTRWKFIPSGYSTEAMDLSNANDVFLAGTTMQFSDEEQSGRSGVYRVKRLAR
jgi:hypothetical protein